MLAEERAVRQRFWGVVTGTALTVVVAAVFVYVGGGIAALIVIGGVVTGYGVVASLTGGGAATFSQGVAVFAAIGAITFAARSVIDTTWIDLFGWGLAWTSGVAYSTAGAARSWRLLTLVPGTVLMTLVSVVLVWVIGPVVAFSYPFVIAWLIRGADFMGPERL